MLTLVSASVPAHAASTITLTTDQPSYTGAQTIKMSGTVSPAPGPNTGVVIQTKNPNGMIIDIDEVTPDAASGKYSYTLYPAGSANWVDGTYVVNATWGDSNGNVAFVTAGFHYTGAVTTTTTSTTSTTTTTTSTTTSTTSTTTTTTTSTTTSTTTLPPTSTTTTSTSTTSTTTTTSSTFTVSTSTTPEFPSSVLAAVALALLSVVAVLSRRVQRAQIGSPRSP